MTTNTDNKESVTEITRTMTIESILALFPHKAQKLAQEISSAGLHCIGCHAATWETLEAGMYSHGKSDEEINTLVGRLNKLLNEPVQSDTITLTPRAAKKYLQILQDEEKAGWGIRFAERMAGCSGFEYVLDYSEKALPSDEVFVTEGIEIHVDKSMIDRMIGSEIDYVDGLQGSGFKISNPNVRTSCGCGSSHSY